MRIKSTLKNFGSGLAMNLVSSLLSFVSRTVFIATLSSSYLGVSGLLGSVLSMLSLAELGIGTAINFSLYKPLAENDDNKIGLLMNFYKRAYRYIGLLVFIIGLILMMFLDFIIKDPGDVKNIKLIFFIYLVNTSYSYLMSYKNTLISADQKAYLLTKANIGFNILNVIIQLIVLFIWENYIVYLLSNMFVLLIQRLYINNKITKIYPVLKIKAAGKLPKEELKIIVKNVKAMMLHKLGDYCINCTDNIIISSFISVSVAGIYSNYPMLIAIVNGIIVMFFSSMTASMGNLIAKESDERKRGIFEVINFLGFWIFGFAAVCFYNLLNPFIELWIGKHYLISEVTVAIIVLNYYLTGMRVPVHTVKAAAGLYDEDKYTPLIQAAVNLVVSIVLVQKLGLSGVFIGTLVSSIILPCWQRPYIIYKYVFKLSCKSYFLNYFKYLLVVIITTASISMIFNLVFIGSTIVNFIIKVVICSILPNIIFLLLFWNSKEFKEMIIMINGLLGGKVKWIKKLA